MQQKKITIIIVEDHSLIRESWNLVLKSNPAYTVLDACSNADDAFEIIRKLKPMIVLMDINMPGTNGIEATKIIKGSCANTKILAISMNIQPGVALKMIKSGASGYLTKDSTVEEMFDAINCIAAGQSYLCQEIKDRIANNYLQEDNIETLLNNLTVRESDIVSLIHKGHSSKEIASLLNLSTKTIEVHRNNIFRKLKIKKTVSLINLLNQFAPVL
ncbi:MAG: response regulator transcription factor [Bacteroidota bacterium]